MRTRIERQDPTVGSDVKLGITVDMFTSSCNAVVPRFTSCTAKQNIEREDAFSARLGRELVPAMWPGLPRDRFPLSGEKFGGQCGLRRPMGNDFLRCEEAELAELQRHIRSLDYGTQADEGADGGPGY